MKSISTRFLFIVWLVDSVLFAWLFIYIFLHGSTSDTSKLAGDLGAVWGGTAAFLIGPFWKAMKLWPARRRTFVLSGLFVIDVVAGSLFLIRAPETLKIETLFEDIH
jgi:hypothetical protein